MAELLQTLVVVTDAFGVAAVFGVLVGFVVLSGFLFAALVTVSDAVRRR